MKGVRKLAILLPMILVCMMLFGVSPVSAASTEFLSGTSNISIYSSTGYNLMDGVREGEVVLQKSNGTKVKAHVVLVKANAKASFKPVIPGYYTSGSTKAQRVAKSQNWNNWSLTGVTNMVRQYQSAADTNKNVIAAINGDFGIGVKPRGSVIMEGGAEIGASSAYEDEFFFGHKSTTGTLNIVQRTSSQKSTFDEAICGGAHILRNGELFGVENETESRQRNGLGIKTNGDTLMITVESGITVKQFAELMKASGCWNGINMDGGGSITMLTKRSGESDVTRRTPLSGYSDVDNNKERLISSALMLVADSNAVANKVGTVSGNTIKTDKSTYYTGEDIKVTATSELDGSWVSILKADDAVDAGSYFWYYTYGNDGASTWGWENGTTNNIFAEGICTQRDGVTAETKLPPGKYRAAIVNYNSSGGYRELASKTFTVAVDPNAPTYTLATDKDVYKVGEPIKVTATSPTTDTGAWVGITYGRNAHGKTGGGALFWAYIPSDGKSFNLLTAANQISDEDYEELKDSEKKMMDVENHCLKPGKFRLILYTKDGYGVATDANGNELRKAITIVKDDEEYAITYKDSISGSKLTGLTPTKYKMSEAQSGAIKLPTTASKTGYTFAGWYTTADCTGTAVTSIPKGSTGAKTYYAKFTPKTYDITFNTGAGVYTVPVAYGSTVPMQTPSRPGRTFVKWVTTEGGTTDFPYFTTPITGSATAYAIWTVNTYKITFDEQGGSAVSDMTYTVDTPTFALPVPTKDKYTFAGWKDTEGKIYHSITKGSVKNLTLTAKWESTETFALNKMEFAFGEDINVTTYRTGSGLWLGLYQADEESGTAAPIIRQSVGAEGSIVKLNDITKYPDRPNAWYPNADTENGKLKSGSYTLYMFDANGNKIDSLSFAVVTSVYKETVTAATCTEGGFTTTLYTDGTQKISDRVPAKGHQGANAADCTADYGCTVCHQLVEGFDDHASSGPVTCTEDEVCTRCNYVITACRGAHSWTEATCTLPKTCRDCETTEGTANGHSWTLATCTKEKFCGDCGMSEGEPLGHFWIGASCKDPRTCYSCGKEDGNALGHNWKADEEPLRAPTCTTEGLLQYSCTRVSCNEHKIETIGKANHDYKIEVVAATCTAEGYTRYDCINCEQGDYAADIVKPSHKPGPAATCKDPQKCLACGAVLEGVLDHVAGAEATCDQAQNCINCGTEMEKAKGHAPQGEQTCSTGVTCKRCGSVIAEPTGHTPDVAATCETAQTCLDCGVVLEKAKGHKPGAAATCQSTQTCKDCGKVLHGIGSHTPGAAPSCENSQICTTCNMVIAAATGHTEQTVAAVAATCTETGLTEGKVCATCGKVLAPQITTPVTRHKEAKTVVTPATKDAAGEIKHLCGCGKELSAESIAKIKTVKLSYASAVYNGKVKNPGVTVKDADGNVIDDAYYTVSKDVGRKNVGKYTYKITFQGNYDGSQSLTLTIKPAAPVIQKATGAKKAVTVKWKKVSKEITGYQVMVATDKKFTQNKKSITVKKAAVSKKVTNLKAKKTYFAKVRTYKTVKINGKSTKIYSAWSKVKVVKTK